MGRGLGTWGSPTFGGLRSEDSVEGVGGCAAQPSALLNTWDEEPVQGRCLTRRAPCLPNPSSLWEHEVSREQQAKGERPSGRWERAESNCRRLGEGRRFTSRPRVRTGEGETMARRESGDRERASGSCLQRPACGGWDGSKESVVRVRASPATPYNSPNKVVWGWPNTTFWIIGGDAFADHQYPVPNNPFLYFSLHFHRDTMTTPFANHNNSYVSLYIHTDTMTTPFATKVHIEIKIYTMLPSVASG